MIAGSFSIRRAEETERRRILSLLALPDQSADEVILLVATEADDAKPVGAGALCFSPNRYFPEHADCLVQVRETHRRHRIGRALLEGLITVARDGGAKQLRSPPLDETSAGFQFAMASGFEAGPATLTFEVPMENLGRMTALYKSVVARGKVPNSARVIPLSEAPREEVFRLVLDHFGFSSQHVAERLRGTEHGFSQTLSRVAVMDGKVIGALLLTYQKALATIDATAVLANYRHSWVNLALKASVVKDLQARRVEKLRFSANAEAHPDTINMARRLKARELRKTCMAVLNLDPAS